MNNENRPQWGLTSVWQVVSISLSVCLMIGSVCYALDFDPLEQILSFVGLSTEPSLFILFLCVLFPPLGITHLLFVVL